MNPQQLSSLLLRFAPLGKRDERRELSRRLARPALASDPSASLGSDKSRGYCVEMICADFLTGAQIENGGPDSLLHSVIRLFQLAAADQQREFLAKIHIAA
jgi:hypothetical protein